MGDRRNSPRFWMRPLLSGRMEVYWSDGITHVHIHAEAKRATEVVQALRDLHGGGPATPEMLEPRFGRPAAAKPIPGQTEMEI